VALSQQEENTKNLRCRRTEKKDKEASQKERATGGEGKKEIVAQGSKIK